MNKLLKRRDFLAAGQGRRWAGPGFVLLAHKRSVTDRSVADIGAARIGFTVTKKIGNAVTRNRLKRRLRALARTELAPVAAPGTDYVLIGRENGLTRSWADLIADLKRGLGKTSADRQDRAP